MVRGILETVDAVHVNCLKKFYGNRKFRLINGKDIQGTYVSWTNDSAVPVVHHDIVAILETIGA